MTSPRDSLPSHAAPRPALSSTATRMLARARQEWQQRRFDAAEQSLANVLALAPGEPEAMRMLGMAAQRNGKHAKAV
ncbi:MAG: tetratricopeptide repeat protein, partial [Proteobacteria bacterium]|nr:tetratricopeptide repeat protein [Pseudomonadota bacterium]